MSNTCTERNICLSINVCVIENWKSRVDGFTSGYIDLIYWYVVEFNVLVSDIFESSVVCSRR
jgi:hypothetical protein